MPFHLLALNLNFPFLTKYTHTHYIEHVEISIGFVLFEFQVVSYLVECYNK